MDTIYLRAKWNRATGQYTGSIHAILLHLFTTYGKITPMDVQVKEQAVSNMAYTIVQPVDVVFDAIEDLADLAKTGLSPIPSQKMVDMAYLILAKEPLLRQDLLQWNRLPAADKTWPNMMEHFRDAQSDMNSLPTAGDVYHQHHGNANSSVIAIADLVAQRLLDTANAADASAPPEAVLPVANAVIADREASLLLQHEAALLTQMQAMMATFTPRNNRTARNRGPRNDRAPASAPAAANVPNNRSTRTTPTARAYCWTHGLCAHASSQCNSRLVGHQVTATFANMQGGSKNNCFWIQN